MDGWIRRLEALDIGTVWRGVRFSALTTWEIGGPIEAFVEPKSPEALVRLLHFIRAEGVPWFVIGRGSNLLALDGGFRGVVLRLGPAFRELSASGDRLIVGGGYPLVRLAVEAAGLGLSGLEFAGGIPGSVGGAVFMNAGAHGSEMRAVLEGVDVVWPDGRSERLGAEALELSYRSSVFHRRPGIVTRAYLRLVPGDRVRIREEMLRLKAYRLRTQPLQERTSGSVFRNPPGDYAARLIEAAGMKGAREGGAVVSTLHANFIVNAGGATARDVLRLIERIRTAVRDRFGPTLETEVRVVGEG
ncbi:UDP-N-acetylmuramate dehydrogenase [Hydrogenibacillus schlegelii]|uniref:UDP-N-acetylenolpyruvoylglucosamine reductase n=1 Tax=Hydrogenibacillus schlegelii TaxID=1484 RepID=A0A132NAI1_HYDSH|nr:UDP-N-acetylmuramate dehydrogenase [Hydrogenibacillus schlegelii]KWX07006.1 hypothetical protein TR75_04215 [Hydrogenibacillus schlegelii]OAR03878.1 hypothetical protein SA87_03345 [Hydrogenibacillus schlegelii]PTQ54777.1 MAG: UDP-N-acetylenolpyruvoylglucosamine reductase [Hydrogenibacillus schlegelii]